MKRRGFLGAMLAAVVAPAAVAKVVIEPVKLAPPSPPIDPVAAKILEDIRNCAYKLYEQSGYGEEQPDRILIECGNESWNGCMFNDMPPVVKLHPDSPRRQRREAGRLKAEKRRQQQAVVVPDNMHQLVSGMLDTWTNNSGGFYEITPIRL